MSVIAVKVYQNQIVIGSDSYARYENVQAPVQKGDSFDKILFSHNKKVVVGGTGTLEELRMLVYYIEDHALPGDIDQKKLFDWFIEYYKYRNRICESTTGAKDCDSNFLLICQDHCFYIERLFIVEIDTCFAIGGAREPALAVLHADTLGVPEALEAACYLNGFCCKPIVVYTISKNEKAEDIKAEIIR
jgi:hypothetical protein